MHRRFLKITLMMLLICAVGSTSAIAQGVPVTNVPMFGPEGNDGSGGTPQEKPMTLNELELNYMVAVGGQSYMKQACGDSSWRQDLEKAKSKVQPENQVMALKGFRSGWNDTRKRFGSSIRICDKVTGGKSQTADNPVANSTDSSDLDELLSGMKAPDMSNAVKSAVGTSDIKLQPTVPKPE